MDGWSLAVDAVQADQGVDLKVGEVKVDVDAVQADEEVDESLLLGLGNMSQEAVLDLIARGELFADGQLEAESLCIDIANIDTTLVSEEDIVTFTVRVDADVELGIRRMGKERLDDKVV